MALFSIKGLMDLMGKATACTPLIDAWLRNDEQAAFTEEGQEIVLGKYERSYMELLFKGVVMSSLKVNSSRMEVVDARYNVEEGSVEGRAANVICRAVMRKKKESLATASANKNLLAMTLEFDAETKQSRIRMQLVQEEKI